MVAVRARTSAVIFSMPRAGWWTIGVRRVENGDGGVQSSSKSYGECPLFPLTRSTRRILSMKWLRVQSCLYSKDRR